jgi:hypothetical protein
MPFQPGQSGNPAGKPKGTPNKFTGAQKDFLNAWDRVGGPETAFELMKVAVEKAKGGDFQALNGLLPYVARKMPDSIEITDVRRVLLLPPDEVLEARQIEAPAEEPKQIEGPEPQ